MTYRTGLAAAGFVFLAACGSSPSIGLLETHLPSSTPNDFLLCSGYGCTKPYSVRLTDAEWAQVRAHFEPPADNPATERLQIAEAVGELERIVGPKTNTDRDKPGATIFVVSSTRGQMDCIDEAYNTSLYLHFMEDDGLLRWHKVGEPVKRGYVIDRWFHNTATVTDNETGQAWVIDSWFGANGEPADITTVEAWLDGWEPEKFSTRPDR